MEGRICRPGHPVGAMLSSRRPADMELQADGDACNDDTRVHHLGIEAIDLTFSLADFLRLKGVPEPFILDLEPAQQAKFQSPFTWTPARKIATILTVYTAAMLAAYSAGGYVMASGPLRAVWSVTETEFNLGITLFVMGFGAFPMVLAPVSEAYGRYWVFVLSGVVFFAGTLGCAVTRSFAGMLVARLVTGCGASVFATLTGGVVSDLYHKEDRNTPMALYTLSVMIGTGIGPLVSGVIVDHLGWQWIFYLQLITTGSITAAIIFGFKETRGNVLLKRKCDALTALYATRSSGETDTHSWSPPVFQPQGDQSPNINLRVIYRSFAFPMRLLGTESVVFWFSVWASFAWAILYMQFASISIVFKDVYGFSNAQVGAVYVAVIVAAILGTVLACLQQPVMRWLWPESDKNATPEGRLLSPGFQSILLPIGLFWFGWTARPSVPWIWPALAVGSCTMGIFSIYLAVFNYLADTYQRYSSSAQAAQSMCRNIFAGIFPLFTAQMMRSLTYKGAGSLLGGIGLLLTAIPWLLSFYGHRIRARSPFAGSLVPGEEPRVRQHERL